MPSSGAIRSQLGPALRALKDHLTAATALVRAEAGRDLTQLRAEQHHLSRTLERVDNLNDKWANLMDRLEGDDLAVEERTYQNFPPPAPEEAQQIQIHFMEIAEQARGILNEIDYLITEYEDNLESDHTTADQQQEHQESVLEQQSLREEPVNPQVNHQTYQQVNPVANRGQPEIRLPELRLDPFNGDPKKWPTFWQLFSANIDQRQMDDIRKMSYLLTFLQGPAKELIAGFVLSNENYARALDLLKSRYGDSRAITEALEAELMNLPQANESSHSLRSFVDSVERICRQLEAYGHVDSSPFVSTAIKSKLPHPIISKLVEKERGSGVRWNCAQLRKELREIVEIREEVQRCATVTRGKHEVAHPPILRNKGHPKGGQPEMTRAFVAPSQHRPAFNRSSGAGRKCSLCDAPGHFPSQCPKYPTPQDRYRRLKEQGRCMRCLNDGHFVKECPSFRVCAQCQGPHHVLVCTKGRPNNRNKTHNRPENKQKPHQQFSQMAATRDKGPGTGSNIIQPRTKIEGKAPDKTITALAYGHLRKKPTAYLMTRKISVASPMDLSKEIPAFVFFDPGSQLSYIAKSLVNQLRPPQIARDDVEVHGFGGTLRDPIRIRSPSYAIAIARDDGGWEELELNWTKENKQYIRV
ncbi:hypothetical protein ACQ4LE_003319 [Meloidogyne hapla]